jgi:hypothetical protein
VLLFTVPSSVSAAPKPKDIDTYELLNEAHLNVEYHDFWFNGMFGNNDYWDIRIQDEETVLVWDAIRQLPYGDLAYEVWFGEDDLKTLENATVEGIVSGIERITGAGIVKDAKGVTEAIKKLNKYKKKYQASKDAIQDSMNFIMSNESTTEATLKVLTYAFATPFDKEMSGRKLKIINQPDNYYLVYDKRDDEVVMTTHNAELQNPLILRKHDSLKVYNGASLVSFSGVSAPEIKTDNGTKEGRRTQQTLQNLTYDIYQILSGQEAVYYKDYADTLVKQYFADMTLYFEEKDKEINQVIEKVDEKISELEEVKDQVGSEEDKSVSKEIATDTDQTMQTDKKLGANKEVIVLSIGEYEIEIEKGFLQLIVDWIEKILQMLKDLL